MQSENQIAQKYATLALSLATFATPKNITFSQLVDQLGFMCFSSILAHQAIHLLFHYRKDSKGYNIRATIRPTEHTITVFGLKLLLDYATQSYSQIDQYKVGGLTGLLSYFIGRPIDQMDAAKRQIFLNENKRISRLEAISVILRHDGLRGFYKHENLLGPLCSATYRAVYFGLYSKLLSLYSQNPTIDYLFLTLGASLGASLASAVPDKLRSYCLLVNQAKSKALAKRNKVVVEMPSTGKLMLEHLVGKEFAFRGKDAAAISLAVVRNWIVLGCFAAGQSFVEDSHHSQDQRE